MAAIRGFVRMFMDRCSVSRDGSSNENNQHESYRGRVELRDPEMKDGDASVILKNVNINDAGTYECQIREKNEKGKAELVTIVNMTVSETQELKVNPGEDATLQCQGHRGADIEVIKWIRPDVKSDDYVFFFRDGSSNENNQHESYRGRVELRDPEMKDGDASVILKNVNINDAGTYECQIREKNEKGKAELVTIVNMRVSGHTAGHKEGGDKEGGGKERNVGLRVGLPVCVILLLLGVGGFVILYNRPKGNQQPAINRHELQNLQRD
ncbi:coxsackievirus and adenovirus receptor homolog isoform X2 [Micropterus salmoides]|uniref:coxsackievirus and adenovirus receptor homolog isoform X2 n=1 Tax=Micropterus salmoides TaxID=27706 RepID=UPI0018EC7673|nr:coxsackievirus and adenovirus receptor homolog isoform X2 [Micropterus salmoides]